MEEKDLPCQVQAGADYGNTVEILPDEVKMLEISEAIHDLDSKLTSLEIALNLNVKN